MNRWIAMGAGALVLTGAVSFATADASTQARAKPQPPYPHARAVVNPSTLDTSVESKFTPVTACRIADTRQDGGIITRGATRAFQVTGTDGFPAQGGTTGGCGIPTDATAVSLSMTAVGETDGGYITVYPDGTTTPVARAISFTKKVVTTAGTQAALGASGKIDAYVGGNGKTHLVLDVSGYYISPMWVEVSSAGAYVKGSRTVGLAHIGTTMEVEPRAGDSDAVFVAAADYNGTGVDTYFYLTVTC